MAPFPRYIDEVEDFDQAIVVTEDENPFKIVHVNKAWEQLCGYSLEECKGKTLDLLQKETTEQAFKSKLFTDIKNWKEANSQMRSSMDNQFVSEVTLTNFKKDGSSFRNFLQIFPLTNESGTKKYFGGFLQEISDEKDVEKTHDIEEVKPHIWYKDEKVLVLLGGILLSFNSGYINGCCLSGLLLQNGRQQAVSAFTGTYTKSGLFLADGDFTEFGFEIRMILSFIFGAFITGVLNPEAKPYQLGPSYGPTFIIGACCLIISSVLAVWDDENDNLFYFTAMANGIQNGMSSTYSGNLIRSTHLTGTSTDIGLIIGQLMRGNSKNKWKCFVLVWLALSFWFGGVISFFATDAVPSISLIFSACLFLFIGMGCIFHLMRTNEISFIQAVTGNWEWEKVVHAFALTSGNGEEVSNEFLLELFDKIDEDGSGEIDEDELLHALERLGFANISIDQVRKMVKMADTDGDGLISKDEWLSIILNKSNKRKGSKRNITDSSNFSSRC